MVLPVTLTTSDGVPVDFVNSGFVNVFPVPARYGDGVTDARAAIQAQIDACEAAGGGIVSLPPGTFIISSTGSASDGGVRFKVANSRTILRGAGMGVTTLKAANNLATAMTGIVRSTSGLAQSNFGVMDLTIDGNKANQTQTVIGFYCGVSPYTQCDVAIAGTTATLSNFGGTGAAHGLTPGQTIFVDSWTQSELGLYGDFVIQTVPLTTSLTITVPAGLANESAVPMYKDSEANKQDLNVILDRVECKNCKDGGSGGYGIDPHERTRNLKITQCWSHHNDGPGIALDGCRDFYVANNLLHDNGGEAIACYTRTRDGVIEGNTGYKNGSASTYSSIGFEGSSTGIVCADNIMRDGYGPGIALQFSVSRIIVKGNILENMATHGIHVRAAADCIITGNVIRDASQASNGASHGIYVDGGQATNQRNIITENLIRGARANKVGYGVNVGSSAVLDAVLADNDIISSVVATGLLNNAGTRTKISSVQAATGMHPGYVAARWYPPLRTGSPGTILTPANRLFLLPFFIPPGARINRQAIEETVAGSGTATYRLGLYSNNRGQPAALLYDWGQVSVTTSLGQKTANPTDVYLEGGFYWAALIGNGQATMPTLAGQAVNANERGSFLFGLASPLDFDDATLVPNCWYYDDAGATYVGSGLPATVPSFTAYVNAVAPLVFMEAG